MSCVDKANAFVHWRRTISTDGITHTSGFVQALPKIKSGKSLTIYLAIATGDGLGVYGASANYIVLVDQTKFPSPDWKIVRPTHESQPNALQLEVKIREDEVAFRLKNNSGTTLRWNSCGFLVLCEDKPLFVRVTQVTSSDVAEIYEPSELVIPGLITLQSQIDNLTINLNALDADLTAEINARIADVDSEEAARIAADATLQAFATNRANHTGTQLAATISDFASAARAQTEAELVAGSGITITPSGAGAVRQLTVASTAGGGGTVWTPTLIPTDAAVQAALTIDFATLANLTGFTWGNQGPATAAIQRKRLYMVASGSSGGTNNRRVLYAPAANQLPATPWCVQVPVTLYGTIPNNLVGIYLKNTTSGKGFSWAQIIDAQRYSTYLTRMNSETAGVSNQLVEAGLAQAVLAITYDGTTFSFWMSPDGQDWKTTAQYSETAAAFIGGGGVYQYGFMVDTVVAGASAGAFNNAVILNQATPVAHGQFV